MKLPRQDNYSPECVHLSLFMGYTSDSLPVPSNLQTLVESECGVVIDTGCSTTFYAKQWLPSYEESK